MFDQRSVHIEILVCIGNNVHAHFVVVRCSLNVPVGAGAGAGGRDGYHDTAGVAATD